jgi:hypothetical protein
MVSFTQYSDAHRQVNGALVTNHLAGNDADSSEDESSSSEEE